MILFPEKTNAHKIILCYYYPTCRIFVGIESEKNSNLMKWAFAISGHFAIRKIGEKYKLLKEEIIKLFRQLRFVLLQAADKRRGKF